MSSLYRLKSAFFCGFFHRRGRCVSKCVSNFSVATERKCTTFCALKARLRLANLSHGKRIFGTASYRHE